MPANLTPEYLAAEREYKGAHTYGGSSSRAVAVLLDCALLTEGELSNAQIANRLHVSEKTIDRWNQLPEF